MDHRPRDSVSARDAPASPPQAEALLAAFHRVMAALARSHKEREGHWPPGRLTMPQFRLLVFLVRPAWGHRADEPEQRAERPATVTELARTMQLSAPTVSGIIGRLVEAGYVKRRRSEADRRVVEVLPTQRGRDLVAEFFAAGDERFRHILGALDPEDGEALLRGLKALERAILERATTEGSDK